MPEAAAWPSTSSISTSALQVAIRRRTTRTSTRSAIRTQANLTSTEETALKAIAADLRVKDDGIVNATRALMAAGAQSGNSQQLQDLRNQRQQVIADHIAQLRTALGTTRFWELDAFIRRTSTVKRFAVVSPPK